MRRCKSISHSDGRENDVVIAAVFPPHELLPYHHPPFLSFHFPLTPYTHTLTLPISPSRRGTRLSRSESKKSPLHNIYKVVTMCNLEKKNVRNRNPFLEGGEERGFGLFVLFLYGTA